MSAVVVEGVAAQDLGQLGEAVCGMTLFACQREAVAVIVHHRCNTPMCAFHEAAHRAAIGARPPSTPCWCMICGTRGLTFADFTIRPI